tara:strand:- start:7259 stop:8257 length:999 start_codon:yes stop_codon:yes gene_type:complete
MMKKNILKTLPLALLLSVSACDDAEQTRQEDLDPPVRTVESDQAATDAVDMTAVEAEETPEDQAPSGSTQPVQNNPNETIGSDDISYLPPGVIAYLPPMPGEPGALPDDREPLNESDRDWNGAYGAGQTMQNYGLALEEGRYDDAYQMWADDGMASGMTADLYETSLLRYDGVQVLTGRPDLQTDGSVEVPVQMYGWIRRQERPFNSYGLFTLEKRADGSNPWKITEQTLQPMGDIAIKVNQIPYRFQGTWANPGGCGTDDPNTIRITSETVDFIKDMEEVENLVILDDTLSYDITFMTEGSGASPVSQSQTLSNDDASLMSDQNIKRIRCE